MARKYEFMPNRYGWAMEECEERYLVALYHDISSRLDAVSRERWANEFESHFFSSGSGVSSTLLDEINQQAKRQNRRPLEVVETDVSDYPRSPDRSMKSDKRTLWQIEYEGLTEAEKTQWKKSEQTQIDALAPPHRTFDEVKAERDRWGQESILDNAERARRREAAANINQRNNPLQQAPEAPPPAINLERILRQLKLLDGLPDAPELMQIIIEKLSQDEALDLAEQIDNVTIKSVLLRRSL